MFAAQLMVTTFREAIFNREQWDNKDDEERRRWLAMLALSRTGVDGPADILVNALTGLRYERDLANLGVGPGLSYYISQIQNVLMAMGAGRNSDKNNTAERTGAKSLYRLTVSPALSMGLTALNAGGPVGWAARYLALTAVTSNSAADAFADATVGEADSKQAKKKQDN
jgi:hypothetical protein